MFCSKFWTQTLNRYSNNFYRFVIVHRCIYKLDYIELSFKHF